MQIILNYLGFSSFFGAEFRRVLFKDFLDL